MSGYSKNEVTICVEKWSDELKDPQGHNEAQAKRCRALNLELAWGSWSPELD